MRQRLLSTAFGLAFTAIIMLLFIPGSVVHAQQQPAPGQYLSPGQLDDLVAPIALYPDPLISQILVASTYPLELVEASQWLLRNPNLSGTALTQAVERQNWDPSVQALTPFPDVLKYLTEDITWTTSLGNAFLAQEADVMDAIQRMRARAAQNGKLATTPQQQVTREYDSGQPVYVIVPRDPDIIYVPVYDPFWIWGPAAYYPYARWYYPPYGSSLYFNRGVSLQFYFGSGWHSAGWWQGWDSWGWRPAWSSHNVVVNNTFIQSRNFNSVRLPVSNRSATNSWSHDVTHRQGVPYPTSAMTERFRNGGNVTTASRPSAVPRQDDRVVSRNTASVQNDRGNSWSGPAQSNSVTRQAAPPRQERSLTTRLPAPGGPALGWAQAPSQSSPTREVQRRTWSVPQPAQATPAPQVIQQQTSRVPTPSAPTVVRQQAQAPVRQAAPEQSAPSRSLPAPASSHQSESSHGSGGGERSGGGRR